MQYTYLIPCVIYCRDYDGSKVRSACNSVDLVIVTAGLSKEREREREREREGGRGGGR